MEKVEVKSGVCGEKTVWQLDMESGRLTVSGTGPMEDYDDKGLAPWYAERDAIREVVLDEGVTTLGDYAFVNCENLEKVSLAGTVEILGTYGLGFCGSLTEVVLPEGVRVLGAKTFNTCTGLKTLYFPLSLKAIDMKVFEKDSLISDVYYRGTREQWDQIRISRTATGNDYLLDANIHFEYREKNCDASGPDDNGGKESGVQMRDAGQPEGAVQAEPKLQKSGACSRPGKEYPGIIDRVKQAIHHGGDGKLYVLAFDLSVPGIPSKPGDCTLLVFPDGKTMMIDAGVCYCEERVLSVARDLDLDGLDYFVLSHPHSDHVGNALAVAKYIYGKGGKIGAYYHIDLPFKDLEPAFAAYLRENGGNTQACIVSGEVWNIGGVKVEILGPTAEQMAVWADDPASISTEEINNLSIIMKFTYGKASYLTAGDLYRFQERKVIEKYGTRIQADVIKSNHHGTFTSNTKEWLKAVSPRIVISECDDIGGTVFSERTAAMGGEYYSTGLDGITLVEMDKEANYQVTAAYGRKLTLTAKEK